MGGWVGGERGVGGWLVGWVERERGVGGWLGGWRERSGKGSAKGFERVGGGEEVTIEQAWIRINVATTVPIHLGASR